MIFKIQLHQKYLFLLIIYKNKNSYGDRSILYLLAVYFQCKSFIIKFIEWIFTIKQGIIELKFIFTKFIDCRLYI